MKATLLAAIVSAQIISTTSFGQWQQISPDTISNYSSVFFTSDNKGFVTSCDPNMSSWSTNALRMTTDGGSTWTWGPMSELCPPAVFFTDSNIGYYFTQGSATGAAAVHKTTNGGATWNKVHDGLPGENVYFVNEQIGYATAANTIAKTIDGGVTWTPQYLGGPSVLDAVFYINKDTGYIGGWYNPVLAKTTNGGATWAVLTLDYSIHALHFLNAHLGYGVGEDMTNGNPVIIKTVDEGATWTVQYRLPIGYPFYFTAVQALDNNNCYVAGVHGTILKTTDGGNTWTPEVTGTAKKINALHCPTNHTCYAVGDSVVLKQTNINPQGIGVHAGATFNAIISPNPVARQFTVNIYGSAATNSTLLLYDFTGSRVATYQLGDRQTILNADELAHGIYAYRIVTEDRCLQSGKLVIGK